MRHEFPGPVHLRSLNARRVRSVEQRTETDHSNARRNFHHEREFLIFRARSTLLPWYIRCDFNGLEIVLCVGRHFTSVRAGTILWFIQENQDMHERDDSGKRLTFVDLGEFRF